MIFAEKQLDAVKLASHLLAENIFDSCGSISEETSARVVQYGTACQEFGNRLGLIDGCMVGFAIGSLAFTTAHLVINVLPEAIKEIRENRKEEELNDLD